MYGKPLVVWSIEAAKRSLLLDRFFVSTDDMEVAQVSTWFGSEVVIRPDALATDESTTLDVLKYHLGEIDADVVVLLQPTSPVRGNIIDLAIERFFKLKGDSLATGFMATTGEWKDDNTRRQELPRYFRDDGCVYIWDAHVLREGRWKGDKPIEMVIPDIYNHDIDTLTDFWAVEGILSHI